MNRLRSVTLAFALLFAIPTIEACASHAVEAEASQLAIADQLRFPFVPTREKTSGSLCTPQDPDFERLRYEERIPYCRRNVSRSEKADIYEAYGVPKRCRGDYTIDHFIPLSIGGTNHRDNLWPEHKSIKALRQNLELDLYKQIDQGLITQKEAIRIITEAKWNPPIHDPSDFEICH